MKRPRLDEDATAETFTSGCPLLDCVLGGGWAERRIINVVGDRSTGKTLLGIEACANYSRKYPEADIYYCECEAAFDVEYAETVGLPPYRVDFVKDCFTVEALFESLQGVVKKRTKPALYIVDSLDALSDEGETQRDIKEGSYGAEKARKMSQIFRRTVQLLNGTGVTLMILSQIRAKLGVVFGKHQTRSGGKSLDFYASQILWLTSRGIQKRTKKKVERSTGVHIHARCEKNKVGRPFRECRFPIYFNFGIEDVVAGLQWLAEVDRVEGLEKFVSSAGSIKPLDRLTDKDYGKLRKRVNKRVRREWHTIEKLFTPKRRKYNNA
jgi:recombination protein RecA